MNKLKGRATTSDDCYYLGPRLRQADKQEIQATFGEGKDPVHVLLEGMEWSSPCYTILAPNNEPIGIFGVRPVGEHNGIMWMLATDRLEDFGREFLRRSHEWVEKLHRKYQVLGNCVDARNEVHIRWLKWIGVNFVGECVHGVEGRKFLEFIHV
jgi:hypothetical protein